MKFFKNNRNVLSKWLLLVMIVAFVSCGNNNAAIETATKTEAVKDSSKANTANIVTVTPEQYKTAGIQTGTVAQMPLSNVIQVSGSVHVPPQNLVSVTTQMGGIIKNTSLLEGSFVKKGQVIATLQNQEYVQLQQDYLQSKSDLEYSSAEYQRQQELAKENVNAKKVLQQARNNYQSALIRVNSLRQRLQLININPASLNPGNIRSTINIYAPTSGYVTKVKVNVGVYVNPNDVMFEIVNSTNMHIELNVFEKDLSKIKPGQKVRYTLANETTERIASVELVGKEIKPDKTVVIHCTPAPGAVLTPGTYVSALIETTGQKVQAVPETAVVEFEGKKYVFLEEKPSTFKMQEITTGINAEGYTEIFLPESYARTNTKIVFKGAYELLSKLKNSEE